MTLLSLVSRPFRVFPSPPGQLLNPGEPYSKSSAQSTKFQERTTIFLASGLEVTYPQKPPNHLAPPNYSTLQSYLCRSDSLGT